EPVQKSWQIFESAMVEGSKFEDQRGRAVAICRQRLQEHCVKRARIQEFRILFPRLWPVTVVRREDLAGNLFGNLEGELKLWRRLRKQPAPKLFGRKLVECEISAHNRKCFRVFAQAIPFERLPRKSPPRKIPFARVNLAQPSFVLPGAAADINVLPRQRGKFL